MAIDVKNGNVSTSSSSPLWMSSMQMFSGSPTAKTQSHSIPCSIPGSDGDLVYDLLDPEAPRLLLDKDMLLGYRIPDVESTYLAQMVGPHRLILTAICFIMTAFLCTYSFLNEGIHTSKPMLHGNLVLAVLVASYGIINAIVYFVGNATVSVSVHEKLTLFFCGSLAFLASHHSAFATSCTRVAMEEEGKTLLQSLSCRRAMYPGAFVVQIFPLVIRQSRPVFGMPLPFLTPLAVLLAYYFDTSAETDVAFFMTILLTFTACIYATMLWQEAKSMRLQFESWVKLQRNTKNVRVGRAKVDRITKALLPARMWHRLRLAEVSFEVSSEQLVAVYRLYDFPTWSVHYPMSTSVALLNDLFDQFDRGIRTIGKRIRKADDEEASWTTGSPIFEKCKAVGETYIVTAGFLNAPLSSRPPDEVWPLVQELFKLCRLQLRITAKMQTWAGTPKCRLVGNLNCPPLQAQCGVDLGSCGIGIVGTSSMWLEVVGEVLGGALNLAKEASSGTIATSSEVQQLIDNVTPSEDDEVYFERRPSRVSLSPSLDQSGSSLYTAGQADKGNIVRSMEIISTPLRAAERFVVLRDRIRRYRQRHPPNECEGVHVPDTMSRENENFEFSAEELESRDFAKIAYDQVLRCHKELRWYRWSFAEPSMNAKFHDFVRRRSLRTCGSLRFRMIGFLSMLLLIASIEPQPITPAAAVLFPLSILAVVLTHFVPSRVTSPYAPWTFVPIFALPYICVAALNPDSVLSGQTQFLTTISAMFWLRQVETPWIGTTFFVIALNIAMFCVEYFRRRPDTEVMKTVYMNAIGFLPPIAVIAVNQDNRLRQEFLQEVLASVYWYAAATEYETNSGLLQMLVPKALVPSLQTTQGAMGKQHMSEATVAILRLQNFSQRFTERAHSSDAALAYVEARYGAIERALRVADQVIERVHTIGDDVVIGGPLLRAKEKVFPENGKTVAFPKYEKSVTGKKEDRLKNAACALVAILLELFRSPDIGPVSCAVHADTALGWLCGRDRPSFLLLGPAMRILGAMLDAVPTMPAAMPTKGKAKTTDDRVVFSTSAFRRIFEDVPRSSSETPCCNDAPSVTFGQPSTWSLRSCGLVTVSQMELGVDTDEDDGLGFVIE